MTTPDVTLSLLHYHTKPASPSQTSSAFKLYVHDNTTGMSSLFVMWTGSITLLGHWNWNHLSSQKLMVHTPSYLKYLKLGSLPEDPICLPLFHQFWMVLISLTSLSNCKQSSCRIISISILKYGNEVVVPTVFSSTTGVLTSLTRVFQTWPSSVN